ncbi:amino acid ABC transporter substrate-binding protein [Psychromonas sp. B3M02]|uniref:transporter substrate-binding domain-containing protein n=1 Tax=Psychromonas sp. B3M02 TaxID=2267226 RepID=UPI000DE8603D|nr:transporter substrate-binding domain-containing protein [Psychromonas sp. B3M02]RBW47851.1 amino acid ABC transporter substrate-binding protein [Psychromonas sp. B3M02]
MRKLALISFLLSTSFCAQALEKIQVRFATDANYYPFEFLTEDKKIAGFDIDIAMAICGEMNMSCSFEHHRFDGLLLTLPFGRYDAVIAALDITSERLEKVDFSDSYYKVPPVFVSKNPLQTAFSLSGKLIGVQANTSNQNYLIKLAPEDSYIVPYFSSKAALLALQREKIDAVFADFEVVNDFLSKQDGQQSPLVISRTESVFVEQFSKGYGIAVKKGNDDLRLRLNEGLKLIVENGTYKQIYDQYFPQK